MQQQIRSEVISDIPRNNQIKPPQIDQQTLNKQVVGFKIAIGCFGLACIILVIFILTQSSSFFSFLFSLDNQIIMKQYLQANYSNILTALYFSIIGFVIILANYALLFYKFTQRQKLVWFHGIFYLLFLIFGVIGLTNSEYNQRLKALSGVSTSDPSCITQIANQCILSPLYIDYKSNFTVFFISFNIFFVLYTIAYHYISVKLLPFVVQPPKQEGKTKAQLIEANIRNETFVSQMFDEYGA